MVDNVNKFTSLPTSIISFLRMEADLSEERANRLRKEAAAIAEKFGITDEQHYGMLLSQVHQYLLYIQERV